MRRIEVIGQKIKEAREQKGMSTSDLAKSVGLLSYILVEDIEAGYRIPPNDRICKKIADALFIEYVSYEEYKAALNADMREDFETNKVKIISKLNEDFKTNLPIDATFEDYNAALTSKIKIK